ncbi:ATP-binding protein [Megalodesulfovibrio gigas]|uniref:ATP-binding protein n=1 Tax=Megalodesulfovibrio gigas (strain ATCC 19364 / DSM 1382 / NCIMB 9332 / VKM B-1759) TaxID=1121448 RepID=T2GE67_MEGG1|nr:ATP-binding protein [Megalodesulfovibrio gigas]AGW14197.1 hypothetical protein DGI_2455 [Megalodesulfovibrio gigas DSM 1382 = ATCC 19364]
MSTKPSAPSKPAIKPKDRDAILQSLRAGVAPRVGLQHIQVGRVDEIKALVADLERIADGGSGIRFIIGEYGSGKTFFLHLIRAIALERGLVTCHADLAPDRRLHASGGQARNLYAELLRSMATRTKPQGGALPSVVERFVTSAMQEAASGSVSPEAIIRERLAALQEMVGGYDFAQVLAAYWRAFDTSDETLKSDAIRWLRGEFTTRTDARAALGVRAIVEDASVYDHLKLMARFVRLAGYKGLVLCLDELVNLFKLANTQARRSNYEQILRILNDSLQGESVGLGFLMGGTPDFLMDPRRGLYSYEALQSRLAENTFLQEGMVDWTSPVLRLANLQPEDIYVLLHKLRHVQTLGKESEQLLPDEGIQAFLVHCGQTIGDAYFRTPRQTIRAFLNLLAVLEQNPGSDWRQLLGKIFIEQDHEPTITSGDDEGDQAGEDSLAAFKL